MDNLAPCYYVSGSLDDNGERQFINFRDKDTLIIDALFHTYSWDTNLDERTNKRVFNKQEDTYNISILVPNGEEGKIILDKITEITEKDVINNLPGKLYFGETYLEGYFISSSVAPSDFGFPKRDMTFLSIHPTWLLDLSFEGTRRGIITRDGLDYNYDYNYNYAWQDSGSILVDLPGYSKSEFSLVLKGPATDPVLYIDSKKIQIFSSISNNESIIISNKDKKNIVYKVFENGDVENIFDLRSKTVSIFDKIESGKRIISWDGSFEFILNVYLEFSEPLRG